MVYNFNDVPDIVNLIGLLHTKNQNGCQYSYYYNYTVYTPNLIKY